MNSFYERVRSKNAIKINMKKVGGGLLGYALGKLDWVNLHWAKDRRPLIEHFFQGSGNMITYIWKCSGLIYMVAPLPKTVNIFFQF